MDERFEDGLVFGLGGLFYAKVSYGEQGRQFDRGCPRRDLNYALRYCGRGKEQTYDGRTANGSNSS
jgi:hypothetical protein